MKSVLVGGAASFLLLALPAAGPAQAPPPQFPSGTEVVLIDLVGRDRQGRVVTDLRPDEVRVFEDGASAEVASFRRVTVGEPPERPPPGAPAPSPASAPFAGTERASVVVLVFDRLSPEGARNARDAARGFLSRPMPAQTWIAVYRCGNGLRALQEFTRDRALVEEAVDAVTAAEGPRDPVRTHSAQYSRLPAGAVDSPAPPAGGAESGDLRFERATQALTRFADSMGRLQMSRGSLYPLLAVVRGLREVEGRKSLLFFSEGLHVPGGGKVGLEDVFKDLVSEANRSNVAFYAFSADGLEAPTSAVQSDTLGDRKNPDAPLSPEASRFVLQGNLQALAEDTGGFLVANTNDLRPGMDKVAAELRSWYEVAYRPPNPQPDGRFRRIEVKVSRPGVVVRTRSGYFARPAGAAPVALPRELPLVAALEAKAPARDVEHRTAALVCVDALPQPEVVVLAEVPLSGIAFTPDAVAGRYSASFFLLGVVKDEQGREVVRLAHDAPLEGPLEDLEAARERTVVVKRTLRLAPGRYRLETVVQDGGTEKLGVRRTVIEIPAAGPGLVIGSLAMVRAEAAGAAEAADDPLRVGEARVVPTLGKSVPEGTPAVSFLLTVRPAPGPEPASVALEVRGDGRVLGRSEQVLPAPDARGRVAYLGALPADRLAPGRYEVWARVVQGAEEATQATSFTVAPGAPPEVAAAATPATEPAGAEPAATAGGASELDALLERAGAYASRYADSFRNVVAEEHCRQWWQDGAQTYARTTRADMAFVRLPGALPWGTFRDVFERDGQPLRPQDGRLEAIFARSKADAIEQANSILRESARQNLGPVYRTANVPTLALLFLLPENRPRFTFELKGRRKFEGLTGLEVAFKEATRPTLVRDRWKNDMPARGRFWIDPGRGTVLRSEVAYRFQGQYQDVGFVSTEYRREPGLDIFVPAEMSELYEIPGTGRVEVTSRYSRYRRFTVAVETEVASTAAAVPGRIEDRGGVTTPLDVILERAGRYVREYEETFRNLVAEETYRQWGPSPDGPGEEARTLLSDLVFVRLSGPLPWGTFRDVFEVDGQKTRDREARLEALFFAPKDSEFARAQAILDESSRFNLGPERNVNVPTLGLLFLRPENQRRLAFRRRGERWIAGFPAAEVEFEEMESPSLVHDRESLDVPARGRFFVDETRGTVLRTEIEYDLEPHTTGRPDSRQRGFVATEYRREPSLGAFVPDTMTEEYLFRGFGRVRATARYASYRRFEVSTGATMVGPITYGPDAAAPAPEPDSSKPPPLP